MTTNVAHFRITGAVFTHLVQQRMLDDAPDAAFRLATSIGSGDPAIDDTIPKIAQRLCDGEAALEGDERSMRVVARKHRKYRTRVAWLHAGRIRLRDRWYQPMAYVSNVGPRDVGSGRGHWPESRAWHYCSADEIVVPHVRFKDPRCFGMERDVIFRACVERPHWHQPLASPQAALDEFLTTGRSLEERSHSKWYPSEPDVPAENRLLDREAPALSEREEAERDAADEASRLRRVADLRELILARAGDDLIELAWEAKNDVPAGKAMIPRAPFVIWCFARLKWFQALLPEWQPISPPGMKIWVMDDPIHTDWVIGGGFDPQDRDLYWGAKSEAAERLRSRLQDEFDERERAENEKVTTLVTGAKVTGVIVHGLPGKTPAPGLVVVIPNLHSRYLRAVQSAAAVITEAGGEVAHLAQVACEQAVPVVRAERALERWGEGDVVEVDPEARTVRVVRRRLNQPGGDDADSGE